MNTTQSEKHEPETIGDELYQLAQSLQLRASAMLKGQTGKKQAALLKVMWKANRIMHDIAKELE